MPEAYLKFSSQHHHSKQEQQGNPAGRTKSEHSSKNPTNEESERPPRKRRTRSASKHRHKTNSGERHFSQSSQQTSVGQRRYRIITQRMNENQLQGQAMASTASRSAPLDLTVNMKHLSKGLSKVLVLAQDDTDCCDLVLRIL